MLNEKLLSRYCDFDRLWLPPAVTAPYLGVTGSTARWNVPSHVVKNL